MSSKDNTENGESNGKQTTRVDGKDVCRDYLNKICNRGTRCKFYHPPGEESRDGRSRGEDSYSFCIDYQNQGCRRENCRFVHAPGQDVDNYKKTGDVSTVLARAIAAITKSNEINGIPFCKEFQANRCTRGSRCRYWHVNIEAERERRRSQMSGGDSMYDSGRGDRYQQLRPQPMSGSRRRHAEDPGDYLPSKRGYGASQSGYPPIQPPMQSTLDTYCAQLESQVAELRRELEISRREVHRERDRYDTLLAAINPAILQQQAQAQYQSHPLNQPPSVVPPQQSQMIQPVPPPGQNSSSKWGTVNAPDWY